MGILRGRCALVRGIFYVICMLFKPGHGWCWVTSMKLFHWRKNGGGEDRNFNQMNAFREVLLDCSLQDLGYIGADFTWTNGRYDGGLVRVRLDRYVANEDWIKLFSGATNSHLSVASSDHMALLLDSRENIQPIPPIRHRRKLFRFEKSWLREQGCEDTIAAAWDIHPIGTAMFRVTQKIKQCRINLLQWSQSLVKATPRLLDSKQRELEELEMCQSEDYDVQAVNGLRRELNGLREKEELFWRQRSRIAWLHEGDRNTKFFHACASQRKRTNTITALRDDKRSRIAWLHEGDRNTKFFHACASQRKRTNTILEMIRTVCNQHQLILRGLLLSISMGFSHRPTHRTLMKLPEHLIVWLHQL